MRHDDAVLSALTALLGGAPVARSIAELPTMLGVSAVVLELVLVSGPLAPARLRGL